MAARDLVSSSSGSKHLVKGITGSSCSHDIDSSTYPGFFHAKYLQSVIREFIYTTWGWEVIKYNKEIEMN